MKHTVKRGLGVACLLLAGPSLAADRPHYDPASNEQVKQLIQEVSQDSDWQPEQLNNIFSQAERRDDIIKLISKPAERVLTWAEYRRLFITDARIKAGHEFMAQHRDALNRAHDQYGVDPAVITAIIGVETFYGRHKGRHRVIDALSTLSFDYPPRSAFFRKQLVAYLELAKQEGLNPLLPMGSYAGAMGFPQFIPTSYQAYAVDFNGDGFRDIWTNPVDAIGSVAHYFEAHGWKKDGPVAVDAVLEGDGAKLENLRKNRFDMQDYSQVAAAGMTAKSASLTADTRVLPMALSLDDDQEQMMLGLHNFYVITRYNHSRLYAMAVNELAKALKASDQDASHQEAARDQG